ASSGEEVRLYACGGDGTLHEVVNGVVGYGNVEVGCFPCGSGNDYVASFGSAEAFLDVAGQVEGSSIEVDLMRTDGIYSVNQCSMGFDAAVADNVRLFKGKPLVSGSMAYLLSIFYTFAGSLGHEMTVTLDDGEPESGRFLFAIAAKGRYQGGGIQSAPEASPTSRSLNLMMVRAVGHGRFLKLLPLYRKGAHLTAADVVSSRSGRRITVQASEELPVVMDGEIVRRTAITTELVEKGMRFILPATVTVKANKPVACPVAAG
ncbi:MAG: hypothetical protein J6X61_03560, partial [Clostridia bacterium]|nr:hypothetical protein [Clostridia bacterium]